MRTEDRPDGAYVAGEMEDTTIDPDAGPRRERRAVLTVAVVGTLPALVFSAVGIVPALDGRAKPLFFVLDLVLIGYAVVLWRIYRWFRRRPLEQVPRARPRDTAPGEPWLVTLLSMASCRLYELLWLHRSTERVRRLTGRPELSSGLDALLGALTLGLWNLWAVHRNVAAVDAFLAARGPHVPRAPRALGLIVTSFLCGLAHWALLHTAESAFDELAREARDPS